ncbi:MAG: hypothetical protein QNJ44_05550 [Rhodobacter sp.]|nr:hypothetical protein [Rhodobacter sp.]
MKMVAGLIFGLVGALLGAGAAFLAGYGVVGIVMAYIAAGVAGFLGAAVIAWHMQGATDAPSYPGLAAGEPGATDLDDEQHGTGP